MIRFIVRIKDISYWWYINVQFIDNVRAWWFLREYIELIIADLPKNRINFLRRACNVNMKNKAGGYR